MKAICDFYISKAKIIGALFCIVPTLVFFLTLWLTIPFREVYFLRLLLSVIGGGALGAFANDYGIKLWLIKHRSAAGPASRLDGALIGAAVGIAVALIPPLTLLIASNHIDTALAAIVVVYLVTMVNGSLIGMFVAGIGIKHLDRNIPAGK